MTRLMQSFGVLPKQFFILLFLTALSFSAFAQKKISGTVRDVTNPLSGATVTVKGTAVATQTDVNGNFTLDVPAGSNTLVVSFVGMENLEVDISNKSTVDVILSALEGSLNEVVVTGYSAQRKKDITGAVAIVDII